jgi:hypothetical protein
MELSGQCQHVGCTQPRGRLSVFCDAHHEEHLKRAGLWIERRPLSPSDELVRQCENILRWQPPGEDRVALLLDNLITRGRHHSPDCWGRALDSLPSAVLRELLDYAKVVPGPRGFSFGYASEEVRTRANRRALELQALLIERLETRLQSAR